MAKRVTGTKEWSSSSVNVIDGCAHDCRYCYAKAQAIRFGRKTPDTWKDEVPRTSMAGKRFGKRKGRIMFPTTHDITAGTLGHCADALLSMLEAGNEVLVVSKPDPTVIASLCARLLKYQEQILFRFTIGSFDSHTLAFWEPNAPAFAERLYSLMWCHRRGWKTSVSVEPMLDPCMSDVILLYETLEPYVTDAIWLGVMNQPIARMSMNGNDTPVTRHKVNKLIDEHVPHNIKWLADQLGHPRPKLKWKESCKRMLGIEVPTEAGLDQ